MSLKDELEEIKKKIASIIDGNVVMNATVIQADVRVLRAKAMKDDPGDKKHIIPALDGIDKDLNGLIEKHTPRPNPK